MPVPCPDLFWAHMQTEKQRFIADYVEQAMQDAAYDGRRLHYTENGMVEPTTSGRRLENDAARTAEDMFSHVLELYIAEAANFNPDGPYNDVVEHVGNEFKPGLNEDENDVLERIGEAHFKLLQRAALSDSEQDQIYEAALILLKTPLEFADLDNEGVLSANEKNQLTGILKKLRRLARLDPARG